MFTIQIRNLFDEFIKTYNLRITLIEKGDDDSLILEVSPTERVVVRQLVDCSYSLLVIDDKLTKQFDPYVCREFRLFEIALKHTMEKYCKENNS